MKTVSFNPFVETMEVSLPEWKSAETLHDFPCLSLTPAHLEISSRQDESDSEQESADELASYASGFVGSRRDRRSIVARMDPKKVSLPFGALSPTSSRIWQRRMQRIATTETASTSCAFAGGP